MNTMIDVTTTILDAKADPEEVARVNEENEWKKRLEELAKAKKNLDKKIIPPKGLRPPAENKRQRRSAIQHRAITRGV